MAYLNPRSGETILDLGCGTGDLTKEISLLGATVIGVDSSAEMIATARSKFPELDFHHMDARELTFDVQFDAVFQMLFCIGYHIKLRNGLDQWRK